MKARVRPTKTSSAVGMVGFIAFFMIGLYLGLPSTGWFGVFWTFGSLAGAILHGVNLFSDHGLASEIVEFDGNRYEPGISAMSSKTAEQRLSDLEALRQNRRISTQEYEEQRKRILNTL